MTRGSARVSGRIVATHAREQPLPESRTRARARRDSGVLGMRGDVIVMQALGGQHQGLRIASAKGHGVTEHDDSPRRAAIGPARTRGSPFITGAQGKRSENEPLRATGQPERQT